MEQELKIISLFFKITFAKKILRVLLLHYQNKTLNTYYIVVKIEEEISKAALKVISSAEEPLETKEMEEYFVRQYLNIMRGLEKKKGNLDRLTNTIYVVVK